MKMATGNVNTIERVGVGADQEFTIDFSAKMASILADGLYSDKIQSVIRELSCNAYDSHVAAGHADTPIEVHFPNRFEPWFHVRDFGTGLSHDEVMSIYTRYGASTKTNSNDFIGALGLGSKSPFALTEAFTVTARKDGVENHYSMYRNEQGMPSVAHLHQNATTEPNGVTVTVPVREDQRNEFIEKSKKVYMWFPVKPNTIGDTVNYDTINYAYQGTGWGIRKPDESTRRYGGYRYSNHAAPVAIMGLVAYPLDSQSIKNLSDGARDLLSTPVVLTFAIGELEIAANREALGYDERTCAAIVAKMDLMVAELGAIFEKEIAQSATLWQAKTKFGQIFSTDDYSYNFSCAFRSLGLKWRKNVIKDYHHNIVPGDIYGASPANAAAAETGVYLANHRYKRPRAQYTGLNESMSIPCVANTVIVFNDVKLGGMTRVTEYNKSTGHNKQIFMFNPSTIKSFDEIRNELGNPDVVYTSKLPKPERKKIERTGAYKWTSDAYKTGRKAWLEVEIDLDNPGHAYYIELDGWDVKMFDKTTTDLGWYVRTAKDAGIIPPTAQVYAMRSKNKIRVREHAAWKELFSTIKDHVEQAIKSTKVADSIAASQELRELEENCYWQFWNTSMDIKHPDSLYKKLCDRINEVRSARNEASEYIKNLATRLGFTMDVAKPQGDLLAAYREVKARYPMLAFATDRYSYSRPESNHVNIINDYINLVDATHVFMGLQDTEVAVD